MQPDQGRESKTTPATAASGTLAVLYALEAAAMLWLTRRLGPQMAGRPDVETSLRMAAAASGLFSFLWAWTALACRRRHASPIVLGTIVITIADILWWMLSNVLWAPELSVLDLAKAFFRAGLVAVVVAWRPRGESKGRDQK